MLTCPYGKLDKIMNNGYGINKYNVNPLGSVNSKNLHKSKAAITKNSRFAC